MEALRQGFLRRLIALFVFVVFLIGCVEMMENDFSDCSTDMRSDQKDCLKCSEAIFQNGSMSGFKGPMVSVQPSNKSEFEHNFMVEPPEIVECETHLDSKPKELLIDDGSRKYFASVFLENEPDVVTVQNTNRLLFEVELCRNMTNDVENCDKNKKYFAVNLSLKKSDHRHALKNFTILLPLGEFYDSNRNDIVKIQSHSENACAGKYTTSFLLSAAEVKRKKLSFRGNESCSKIIVSNVSNSSIDYQPSALLNEEATESPSAQFGDKQYQNGDGSTWKVVLGIVFVVAACLIVIMVLVFGYFLRDCGYLFLFRPQQLVSDQNALYPNANEHAAYLQGNRGQDIPLHYPPSQSYRQVPMTSLQARSLESNVDADYGVDYTNVVDSFVSNGISSSNYQNQEYSQQQMRYPPPPESQPVGSNRSHGNNLYQPMHHPDAGQDRVNANEERYDSGERTGSGSRSSSSTDRVVTHMTHPDTVKNFHNFYGNVPEADPMGDMHGRSSPNGTTAPDFVDSVDALMTGDDLSTHFGATVSAENLAGEFS